jgi:hypothetical protein
MADPMDDEASQAIEQSNHRGEPQDHAQLPGARLQAPDRQIGWYEEQDAEIPAKNAEPGVRLPAKSETERRNQTQHERGTDDPALIRVQWLPEASVKPFPDAHEGKCKEANAQKVRSHEATHQDGRKECEANGFGGCHGMIRTRGMWQLAFRRASTGHYSDISTTIWRCTMELM